MTNHILEDNNIPYRELNYIENNLLPIEIERFVKKKSDKIDLVDYDPHRHNFYVLTFINKAQGSSSVDFKKIKSFKSVKKIVMLIRPEQVHISENVVLADLILIRFTKEFLQNDKFPILDENENVNLITMKPKEYDSIYKLAEMMLEEFQSKNDWRLDIIQSYFNSMLALLSRAYQNGKSSKTNDNIHEDITSKFCKLVNLHFVKYKKVDEYAKMLFVSPGHLNDTIKAKIGKTAKEIILERVVLEAKRLLYYNDYSIKEVSDILDFQDVAYFSRFFKNSTGLSPMDFRMKFREKCN